MFDIDRLSHPPVPKAVLQFFEAYPSYIIASHREPDGDSVGSSLALASFLGRKGKRVQLVSAGPFKRTETRDYAPLFSPKAEAIEGPCGLVILDCSGRDRLGDADVGLDGLPFAVIDHHATNAATNPVQFVEPTSPSTTLLVQRIIEAVDGKATREEAEFLLFGLCTDTGFFRHLDDSSAATFACVARLVSYGANPKRTFAAMNGGKSLESRILLSRILSRLHPYYAGGLMISWETLEDTAEFGLEGRDSDTLYQLIQSIRGVEAIVIVRQETETNCTVGFRSLDRIDVSVVATSFGGGGHRQASGLSIPGKIHDLIPRFVEAFRDQFPGIDPGATPPHIE